MPVEVGDSSWGSVCVPAGHVYGASGGSGRGSGSCISGRLPTSVSPRASTNDCSQVLQMPQANNEFPNKNIENVTERSRLEMHDWNLVSKTTQRMKSCLKDRTTPYTPHTAGILSQRQHDIWNLVRKRQHNTAYTPHNSWNLVSKTTQYLESRQKKTTQPLESCLKDRTTLPILSKQAQRYAELECCLSLDMVHMASYCRLWQLKPSPIKQLPACFIYSTPV